MDSINRMAIELVDEALDFAGELGIEGYELDSGTTVIDFGVDADGGVEAGMLLTEIQTAGLATVQTRMGEVAGTPRQYVELSTDRPALALLCSQKGGWELVFDDFDGLGSGPARALVGEEEEFHHLGYYDEFDLTVLAVESIELPTDEVAEHVADMTDLEPSAVFLPTYATGSVVGSVTSSARAPELAMFNLFEAGYDPNNVISVSGSAPLAPVSYDESVAMGRTNDAVAYGGRVHMTVHEDFDDFDSVISTAGEEYGVPFEQVFEDAGWDFNEVDPGIFGPAQVTIDVVDGPTYTLGETDEDVLAESFGL
ncbi:methenyltetrahydromethanopterin cyclohydrolase [Haloferax larsenii]|uniref:Methenyltetrahydromethanopterin cyclohydrolase n=1 Tax=Haloferax larsenii TaxID=302484 RepID=A0ABY5RGQ1_HALLR|nr:methenyltetrahydromethanopterin cyclohydrolase [Haloferax larsenii]ELZ78368.1 N(5),N(10)-methenyltetrahydromethanopterin cyclohydrolase [Haloferax larsenii JCM 13917]UVE50345.1 methenyltetrahydromethanopterin cyclohydrolase [Haloferax larsenii]